METELVALVAELFGKLRRTAVEDGDGAFVLIGQLLEHFVPVGSSGVGAGRQTRDEISLLL